MLKLPALTLLLFSANSLPISNSKPVLYFFENTVTCLNNPFPIFSSVSINGDVKTDKNLRGKITVIVFWFESCPPCITEMKALKKIMLSCSTNDHFQFFSFTPNTKEEAIESAKKYALPYTIFPVTKDECYRLNCNDGFPVIMITDENNIIRYIKEGASFSEQTELQEADSIIIPKINKMLSALSPIKKSKK